MNGLIIPIIIKTPIKESNLSNSPPCPGRIEPESLIKKTLLSFDAAKSPRNENTIMNTLVSHRIKAYAAV